LQKTVRSLEIKVQTMEDMVDALALNQRYTRGQEIGFNGQQARKRIFRDLMDALQFDAIIETGTWTGNTTGYMAETTGLPVWSCELNHRFHFISKTRLADFPEVHLALGDSRSFLAGLLQGELARQRLFYYLDAHWYDDLPLVEELGLIGSKCDNFVVMIDDFQVPEDSGYKYDDYGPGKALALGLIKDVIECHHLATFFPATPSTEDTGARRGCIVISPEGAMSDQINQLGSLRRVSP
jgi:hypothetical protein